MKPVSISTDSYKCIKLKMKYDTRNPWQKIVDKKWTRYVCIGTIIILLGLILLLVALLFTIGRDGTTSTEIAVDLGNLTSRLETNHTSSYFWDIPPSTAPSTEEEKGSPEPSLRPTHLPSFLPTKRLSSQPSFQPTKRPSFQPSSFLSTTPSNPFPSSTPTNAPSAPFPSQTPTTEPSPNPSNPPSFVEVTYEPGNLLPFQNQLALSVGLKARKLAKKNQFVTLLNGTSTVKFHERPDYGATFGTPDGGWIYVTNSEIAAQGQGGVGAIKFDKDGNIERYDMILTDTTMNCGGGKTPWNTYISCEEVLPNGQVYQVDVHGQRVAQPIRMGLDGGRFESFAYDDRGSPQVPPRFFVTEDHARGALRRFIPDAPDWSDPWTMLHNDGNLDFLVLDPDSNTFRWTQDIEEGRESASRHYPNCEGIDVNDGMLYVVSKSIPRLFILDLDSFTYTFSGTQSGVFDGRPDQIKRILVDDQDILYFTEEGGKYPGVHGRNNEGEFFTILEGNFNDETTGLAFSPSGKFMYVAFQERGLLFQVSREDGLPFQGRSLNVKYHNQASTS